MKVLIIARTCPYYPNDGEKIRVFNMVKNLAEHDITLVCRIMSEEEKHNITQLNKFCKSVKAVYIPSPSSFFEKIQWVLPFVFSKYPIGLSTVYFKEILQVLNQLCKENNFDIIQVEHSSLTIYLDRLNFVGNSAKLLIMHNIDYLRNSRVIKTLPFSARKIFHLYNQSKFKQWELDAIKRYDCVVTMSNFDKEILSKENPDLHYEVLENGVDTKNIQLRPHNSVTAINNIIFVASMDSTANHDGAMFFINEIFQLVKDKVPDSRVTFVGRNPNNELSRRHNGKDIIVTGMVDSVLDYYADATVTIVPLRSGGGTRLKILESMAAGVAVVSTSVGAEGLNLTHGEDVLIADTPETFAENVIQVLQSPLLRSSITVRARQKVEQEYDWSIIAKKSDRIYHSLFKR